VNENDRLAAFWSKFWISVGRLLWWRVLDN